MTVLGLRWQKFTCVSRHHWRGTVCKRGPPLPFSLAPSTPCTDNLHSLRYYFGNYPLFPVHLFVVLGVEPRALIIIRQMAHYFTPHPTLVLAFMVIVYKQKNPKQFSYLSHSPTFLLILNKFPCSVFSSSKREYCSKLWNLLLGANPGASVILS